jgi:hypothetical protein
MKISGSDKFNGSFGRQGKIYRTGVSGGKGRAVKDGVNASMQDSQGDLFNGCPDCWVRKSGSGKIMLDRSGGAFVVGQAYGQVEKSGIKKGVNLFHLRSSLIVKNQVKSI